jgi:hypothetical protein
LPWASAWRQTYSPVTNTKNLYYQNEIGQSSLQPSTRLRNENLTWESKYSTNLGLDMTFWNRLNVTFDFYNDVTKDLIMEIQLPSVSGYRTQYQNLGQTTNRGVELSLNANLINKKDFFLDFNFNIAFNKNRVDALYGSEDTEMIIKGDKVEVGSDNYRVFVGQEVGLLNAMNATVMDPLFMSIMLLESVTIQMGNIANLILLKKPACVVNVSEKVLLEEKMNSKIFLWGLRYER